jgi:hypothetical protein
MKIHIAEPDVSGAGRWDRATGRYIPQWGGMRFKLPLYDADPKIPRYHGFVGIDERLTESTSTIRALFKHLGGAAKIAGGQAGTLASRIHEVMEEQRKAEELALAAAAKPGGAPAAE